jgi:hypothetical protein
MPRTDNLITCSDEGCDASMSPDPNALTALMSGWTVAQDPETPEDRHVYRCPAHRLEMTPEEREAQRRSFAYGNASLSNPDVTRELVDRVADEMARDSEGK